MGTSLPPARIAVVVMDDGEWSPRSRSGPAVLVVTDGQCVIEFVEERHTLTAGDTFVVPADECHQVIADPAFRAAHVMPREIRFEFDT